MPDARIGFGIVRLQEEMEEALGVSVGIHSVPDPNRTNTASLRNDETSKVLIYGRATG